MAHSHDQIDPERANPKDANGRAKLPLHLWPYSATAAGAVGLLEGQLKYGRTNWRATPVFAHIYLAAAMRHLSAWFEGEDFSDEGAPHLGNALACIAILVDAGAHGTLIDDRQYDPTNGKAHDEITAMLLQCAAKLKARFGDVNPKHFDQRDMAAPLVFDPTKTPGIAQSVGAMRDMPGGVEAWSGSAAVEAASAGVMTAAVTAAVRGA